jgi:hypothetical protein
MELGNLIFGNSRGEFPFPDRSLVNCKEWETLLKVCECDGYGYTKDKKQENKRGGYENEMFCINPYYWGDDEDIAVLPNFIYKPTNFTIDWYKYPFRDSYMNKQLTEEEIKKIFQKCCDYVLGEQNDET